MTLVIRSSIILRDRFSKISVKTKALLKWDKMMGGINMFYCEICNEWMDCWNDCENCDTWRAEHDEDEE